MPKLSRPNFRRDSQASPMARSLKGRLPPPRMKGCCQPAGWPQTAARKLRQWSSNVLAAAQLLLWEKQFACAIRSTGSSCPGSHAWCAAECRRIRTTSRLHNRVPLDTESATNLLSRFAESITASYIGPVMRQLGGRSSTSIHFQSRSSSGSKVRPMLRQSRAEASVLHATWPALAVARVIGSASRCCIRTPFRRAFKLASLSVAVTCTPAAENRVIAVSRSRLLRPGQRWQAAR
jgi:hypothetical protein